MILSDVIEKLACPKCKGALYEIESALFCDSCKLYYPIVNDIPYLLLEHAYSNTGDKYSADTQEKYWDDAGKSANYLVTKSPMRSYMDIVETEEPLYWLKPSSEDMILDLGCGSGRQLGAISETSRVIGIDRSIGMLQRAKKILNEENGFLVLGDALDLPFKNDTFNKISSVRVIQHLSNSDKKKTLRECYRILSEEGYVQLINYQKWTPHHLFIIVSMSALRHPLNLVLFAVVFPLSILFRLWKINIDSFSNIFSWNHPEIVNFSSVSEISKQLKETQFENITIQKFQVGDVFLSTILARAWSKRSKGTIAETFSLSKSIFPNYTRRRYERNLKMDRAARNKKPIGWHFKFKDKVIAMAKKRVVKSV